MVGFMAASIFGKRSCSIVLQGGFKLPLTNTLRCYATASTDSTAPVLLSVQGHKAILTLNRPRTGNSLDSDLQSSLTAHLKKLAKDDSIRAVVLTGNGRFFCTGMNLGAQGEGMKGNFTEQFERATQMFRTVEDFPKPTIAIIQGSCYGGGNGLAMACDIRIVSSPKVSFTLSEVKIGFIPAIISRYIVREWGVAKAREAMLTARSVPATELLSSSAVHHIAEDADAAHAKADEFVELIVGGAPEAQANVKVLVNSAATESGKDHHEVIKGFFLEMMRPCEEGKYGLECFQKKVKPDWSSLKKK